MNKGVDYRLFYEILLNLREAFHSYGRIDDSNSKLDEIVKLIMLSYYQAKKGNSFGLEFIRRKAKESGIDENNVAEELRILFSQMATDKMFLNSDGTSIFGANASLNIQPTENLFAEKLVSEIERIDFYNLLNECSFDSFDVINECFGHFVRENFRNNKEDAQYMTPAEITAPVLDCIFSDFYKEGYFEKNDYSKFTVMDPTCGVGTLLIAAARKYISVLNDKYGEKSEPVISRFLKKRVVGQDKVDRMVRLSKMNALLLGSGYDLITAGNSISSNSAIDEYKGKVDFIFTNPPFGAEYNASDLNFGNYPFLDQLHSSTSSYSSELLLLLKCIGLLKDGGKLAIVLPDSIFSSKGINAELREIILAKCTINAVFELPAVTFAQAGTRTKTSILYLTKKAPNLNPIIMASCESIGYTVKERLGVPVKIACGDNDMIKISSVYCSASREERILNQSPSVTQIALHELIDNVLNPSFYSAERFVTVNSLAKNCASGFSLRPLSSIARFSSLGRKAYDASDSIKHISVLHINPDCTIDFQQVLNYSPVCKGRECFEGDLLFSKINPRIPRMAVVPSFELKLVCSNEFEIIIPTDCIGKYVLCLLLKTSYVTKQIESLTSGTSSSHSRIKREQLQDIKIPYPVSSEAKQLIETLEKDIKEAFETKYEQDSILRQKMIELERILVIN